MVILLIILIGAFLLLLWMIREAFLNKVVKHELTFVDFPASFGKLSLFYISDVHRRKIADKIIGEVKGKADLVIIGGDLTEKGVPMERVKENLKKLASLGPVFFVWGNNDYEADYHELDALLLDMRVKALDNTAVNFESDKGDKLSVLGIDSLNKKRDRLELALQDAEKDSFKILVSHYPDIIEKIKPEHEISLVLSGHTHGGQIHLLGYHLFERGKIKKVQNTILFISNGYGTTSVPLRLGAPAECHLITLKP